MQNQQPMRTKTKVKKSVGFAQMKSESSQTSSHPQQLEDRINQYMVEGKIPQNEESFRLMKIKNELVVPEKVSNPLLNPED